MSSALSMKRIFVLIVLVTVILLGSVIVLKFIQNKEREKNKAQSIELSEEEKGMLAEYFDIKLPEYAAVTNCEYNFEKETAFFAAKISVSRWDIRNFISLIENNHDSSRVKIYERVEGKAVSDDFHGRQLPWWDMDSFVESTLKNYHIHIEDENIRGSSALTIVKSDNQYIIYLWHVYPGMVHK